MRMPKYTARIFLEIIDVRVERLRDISIWASESEGVEKRLVDGSEEFKDYLAKGQDEFDTWGETYYSSPTLSFYSLWDKIYGVGSWEQNPWVWVIRFALIDRPDNFLSDVN